MKNKVVAFQKQAPAWMVVVDEKREPDVSITQNDSGREFISIFARTWAEADRLRKNVESTRIRRA